MLIFVGPLSYVISYNIISKILAHTLKKVLPKLITPLQCVFVFDIDIHDNILVAHEILNSFWESWKKKENDADQLNVKQAYDTLQWKFIEKCFIILDSRRNGYTGFLECIRTTNFSVLINDILGDPFTPERDIWQPIYCIFR